jgi:hypothetical protein
MDKAKHQSQRSVTRLLGQGVDAAGNVTGVPVEIRLAHVFVHEKRKKSAAGDPLDKPRYDSNILVPKLNADPTQCPNYALIAAHCMEAATKAWGQWPVGGKWPIQDGDVPHAQKLKPGQTPLTAEQIATRNKWRTGCWIIEVTNYMDPGPRVAVLQNSVAVEIPAKVVNGQALYKSGDYGYVSLNAYTFDNKTFGVNFGFEGVLFTRPGDPIGSSGPRSAAAMFGGVAGMAPPAGTASPPGVVGAPPALPTSQAVPAAPQYSAPVYSPPTAPPAAPAAMAPPPVAPGSPAYAQPQAPTMTYPSNPAPALPPFPGAPR